MEKQQQCTNVAGGGGGGTSWIFVEGWISEGINGCNTPEAGVFWMEKGLSDRGPKPGISQRSSKEQRVNTWGFVGPVISVTTFHLCDCEP